MRDLFSEVKVPYLMELKAMANPGGRLPVS